MQWLSLLLLPLDQILLFVLVLSRISGLMMVAPIYGGNEVPTHVCALLAVALSLIIVPTQWMATGRSIQTLPDLGIAIAGELLIGLVLSLGVLLVFTGVQVAGQMIAQLSGMSLADVFNPTFETNMPLFSQFLYMFTMAIFVTIGGHRWLMAGMLDTFAAIPPGGATVPIGLADTIIELLTQSFMLGIRASAPVTVALLLATLVLGLIGRTLPQLNILALGFGINAVTTFGMMAVSMSAVAWAFQDALEPAMAAVFDLFRGQIGG